MKIRLKKAAVAMFTVQCNVLEFLFAFDFTNLFVGNFQKNIMKSNKENAVSKNIIIIITMNLQIFHT